MYESTFHDESADINLTLLVYLFYYIDGQSEKFDY
jgi:hypothetical protein